MSNVGCPCPVFSFSILAWEFNSSGLEWWTNVELQFRKNYYRIGWGTRNAVLRIDENEFFVNVSSFGHFQAWRMTFTRQIKIEWTEFVLLWSVHCTARHGTQTNETSEKEGRKRKKNHSFSITYLLNSWKDIYFSFNSLIQVTRYRQIQTKMQIMLREKSCWEEKTANNPSEWIGLHTHTQGH